MFGNICYAFLLFERTLENYRSKIRRIHPKRKTAILIVVLGDEEKRKKRRKFLGSKNIWVRKIFRLYEKQGTKFLFC